MNIKTNPNTSTALHVYLQGLVTQAARIRTELAMTLTTASNATAADTLTNVDGALVGVQYGRYADELLARLGKAGTDARLAIVDEYLGQLDSVAAFLDHPTDNPLRIAVAHSRRAFIAAVRACG